MIKPTEKIWHNGKFIDWDDATIHVLSHVVSYGSSVFEGIRCYSTPVGTRHFPRSRTRPPPASIRPRSIAWSCPTRIDQLADAMLELVRVNNLDSCYLRPIVLRGYGDIGVLPTKDNPIETYIACWEWGKYLGEEALAEGVDVCVSSWTRIAPNTLPALAKAGANYMNSQFIQMEAHINGYAEGIALDDAGLRQRGLGREHLRGARRQDPHAAAGRFGAARHHARQSVIELAQSLGIPVVETLDPARDAVHRRRSVLHGHRGRDHADPLGRSDHGRQGPARTGHGAAAEGVLRDREGTKARSLRMADAGSRQTSRAAVAEIANAIDPQDATPDVHLPRDFALRIAPA